MSFTQFHNRVSLSARIDQNGEIVMMFCRRCEKKGLKCKLFFLFSKCSRCVAVEEKCQAVEPTSTDFSKLDRAMKRLEQKKLKTETILNAAAEQFRIAVEQIRLSRIKLRRLQKQKKFLKNREKKLFDKNLSDVEEFERLKKLEKANEVQRAAEAAFFVNDFFTFEAFFPGSLFWLDQFVVDETLEGVFDSF